MSTLSNLKLVAVKKPTHIPVVQVRRNKLSSRLWEQIQLAKSQIDGKPFVVNKFRSFTDKETGERKQLQVPKRIKPWWFVSESGKVCFSVKYGSSILELAKGKPSVEVASAGELVGALMSVKEAVDAGELDNQIQIASSSLKNGFKR